MSDFADWPEDPNFLPDQPEMATLVAQGWPFGLRSTDRGSILISVGNPEREVVCVPAEISHGGNGASPAMILLAFSYGVVQAEMAGRS